MKLDTLSDKFFCNLAFLFEAKNKIFLSRKKQKGLIFGNSKKEKELVYFLLSQMDKS